ncbi:MAG: VC0807 family protein [Bacteriovoracaceae bacterium]
MKDGLNMENETAQTESLQKTDNTKALKDLVINIIFPTIVLNNAGKYLGEHGGVKALIVALAIPLGYAAYDLVKNSNKNLIAAIGFVSLLLTGGLGLLQLEGFWFAVKEAGIPLLIGLIVLGSAFSRKPLVKLFIFNKALMQTEKIKEALKANNRELMFEKLLKKTTFLLSLSFFLSSLINYKLAINIFKDIPAHLSEAARSELLNQQIAEMTWQGYVIMLIPSMVSMGLILWYLSKGIEKHTGYSFNDVIKHE